MLKAKFVRSYQHKTTGNTVYVYAVSGSKDMLESYEQIQGDKLVIDDNTKEPLWFTIRACGQQCNLIITSNNKVVADMSKLQMAESLAEQFPNLAPEISKQALASMYGNTVQSNASAEVPENKEPLDKL